MSKLLSATLAGFISWPAMSYGIEATERPDKQQTTTRLQTVKVEANAEVAGGPVDGYHAKNSATGTKTDTPLENTPVSVQVISRQVMDDQQVLTLADAVANVSGVYTRQGPDGGTSDMFNIRGFTVSTASSYWDGVKDFSRAPKETAGLERIEILKGPAAIMYGRIEPGGMINRISKRPQAEEFTKVQQQVGSDNYFRTTIDSNGKLSADNTLLYHVNVAVEDADGYKDDTHNKRTYVAPQIEWQASDSTNIRTGLEYQTNDRSWALTYGTIGNSNGPIKDLPISTNFHDKDDYYEDNSLSWFLTWNHELNESWNLQQRITYVDRNSKAEGTWLYRADASGNYSRDYWGWDDEKAEIISTNIDLTGKFATGNIQHTLLTGIDYFDEDNDSGGWAGDGTILNSNIYAPNHDDAPYDLNHTSVPYWYTNKNIGVYVQDQMAMLDERLHILVGVRHDSANYDYLYDTTGLGSDDKATTWRGGVLYKLTPQVSVYTSYVEGFGASNIAPKGEKFDPQTSDQYEIGTKVELTPNLGITLAAFQLIKDNLTMADPNNVTKTILAGEATSNGGELDITGKVTDNWSLIASYAYTDVRYTRSDRLQGQPIHSVPRHGGSLWNTYKFADSGWRVGGGIVYRGERLAMQRSAAPSLYPYMLDSYTLINAMVGYDFKVSTYPVKAQLNISNATDERYYPSTYGSFDRIALGSPRSIMGSINIHF